MRYPAEHKQQTRERIVQAAGRRFRSRGSEGTVIGDLMLDLRLTHGGFYRHFHSKEELFAEALDLALDQLARKVLSMVENGPPGGELKALIESYLDIEHCGNVASGCPVAPLAAEMARRPSKARAAFVRVLRNHILRLAKYVPGKTEAARERTARVLFSGMAGTLTMARVLIDDQQRQQFLDDAKKFYFDAVRQ
jgi:TetR/AcrR family transcriptional repressor of nem operon